MKKLMLVLTVMAGMSMIVSSCNLPVGQAAATEPPPSTEIPLTAAPLTEAPITATDAPAATDAALVPINLAGPPMELGSKYKYVDGAILVAVPGGKFIMGYNAADNPVHEVSLSSFWIYSSKVTNAQYAYCVQTGKCSPPDLEKNENYSDYHFYNHPVTGVTHAQAGEYCTFVNGRLPTEAEWEKTARGPEGNLFPWGDEAPNCDLLNYKFCVSETTPINQYENGISYYGAFDLSGNAREWVGDWYSPTYYSEAPVDDPLGPILGEKRSVRGSSYQDSADPSISAHRFSLLPDETLPDLGFRCVVEDPTYFAPSCTDPGYIGKGPLGEPPVCEPDIRCNDVSITQAPNCTGKPYYIPYTIVSFSVSDTPPDAWTYDLPGCTSPVAGDAAKFQCDLPGPYTASAMGTCQDFASCAKECPEGYYHIKDSCVWAEGYKTPGTACFGGGTYNPNSYCCDASPSPDTSFDLCPDGMYRYGETCVYVLGVVDTELETVLFDTAGCHPPEKPKDPGGDDPGQTTGCQIPTYDCSNFSPATWDASQCCCAYKSVSVPGSFCVFTP